MASHSTKDLTISKHRNKTWTANKCLVCTSTYSYFVFSLLLVSDLFVFSKDYLGVFRFVAQVFQQFFWMRHHGGPTPKRTMLLCSCKRVGIMDRGRLQEESHHSKSNLARKYLDSSGRTRWQGTSALKGSQPLSRFCFKITALVRNHEMMKCFAPLHSCFQSSLLWAKDISCWICTFCLWVDLLVAALGKAFLFWKRSLD